MSKQYTGQAAVIIPCHNYADYLGECIESVLAQTLIPREIIVVDDSSTDNTKKVASRYVNSGVRYIRGEWKSVGAARNAGMNETTAPFVLCLDADDAISPCYIAEGFRAFDRNTDTAIVYPDLEYIGNKSGEFLFPDPLDWKRFDTKNSIQSASMVRREALLQAGSWSHGIDHDGDWITWRRILHLGWKAVKSKGIHRYRIHDRNMSSEVTIPQGYAKRAGFLEEPATLCIALSGRNWAWPLLSGFLERQTFPHNFLHLILIETSQDSNFATMVKAWLASCDYCSSTFIRDTTLQKGLADVPRSEVTKLVSHAVGRLYNQFAQLSTTTLTLFLEDDMIPPDDAYPRIIQNFDTNVLSVNAAYRSRKNGCSVGWLDSSGTEFSSDHPMGEGVSSVYGYGFGCSAIRTAYLKHNVFRSPEGLSYDFDFYDTAIKDGWKTLVDWNCVCRHYHDALRWV